MKTAKRFLAWQKRAQMPVLVIALAIGAGAILQWMAPTDQLLSAARGVRPGTGGPQLVSVLPLPELGGALCEWEPASATTSFTEMLQQQETAAPVNTPRPTPEEQAQVNLRKPVRMIKDSYSAFSSIAVDIKNDEVVMTDESLFNVLAFNRLENTPPTAKMSEPKRMIGGLNTSIEYQCGVYIDQATGDIYAVNNDTVDKLVIFSREQRGDVAPMRIINTPHTTYGIAVDEPHQELFLTAQESASVTVFHKFAKEDDPPIRLLQGDKTLIADPHGIAVDSTRDLLFVSNFGSVATHEAPRAGEEEGGGFDGDNRGPNWPIARAGQVPGTGRYLDASITVYPRDAAGDVAPMRVISGPRTLLNWPTALSVDTRRGELYVANDTGDSILVFNVTDNGNVAPQRMIKGPKSMVKSPTGVFYDWEHDEVWVSNFGNHTATVYKATASGDVPPLRMIRSAPLDVATPNIGNAYAPAYDPNRNLIIVPN